MNLICTKHIKNSIYILIYSDDFCTISKIYSKLGQHNYRTKDPDNIKEYTDTYSTGIKSIYVGQLKAGTNEAEGVGIKVWDSGFTQYLNNINKTGVFMRESGRMISLMDMGDLQSCWSWNTLKEFILWFG